MFDQDLLQNGVSSGGLCLNFITLTGQENTSIISPRCARWMINPRGQKTFFVEGNVGLTQDVTHHVYIGQWIPWPGPRGWCTNLVRTWNLKPRSSDSALDQMPQHLRDISLSQQIGLNNSRNEIISCFGRQLQATK